MQVIFRDNTDCSYGAVQRRHSVAANKRWHYGSRGVRRETARRLRKHRTYGLSAIAELLVTDST